MKEAKLLPEFLGNCDVLEQSFKDLLTSGNASIRAQFEDFSHWQSWQSAKYDWTWISQIYRQAISWRSLRRLHKVYLLWIVLIIDFAKFYLFFLQRAWIVNEDFHNSIVSRQTFVINWEMTISSQLLGSRQRQYPSRSYVLIQRNWSNAGETRNREDQGTKGIHWYLHRKC